MVRVPSGWTDIVRTPRAEVELLAPGLYDKAHPMVERNGYLIAPSHTVRLAGKDGSTVEMKVPRRVSRDARVDRLDLVAQFPGVEVYRTDNGHDDLLLAVVSVWPF